MLSGGIPCIFDPSSLLSQPALSEQGPLFGKYSGLKEGTFVFKDEVHGSRRGTGRMVQRTESAGGWKPRLGPGVGLALPAAGSACLWPSVLLTEPFSGSVISSLKSHLLFLPGDTQALFGAP